MSSVMNEGEKISAFPIIGDARGLEIYGVKGGKDYRGIAGSAGGLATLDAESGAVPEGQLGSSFAAMKEALTQAGRGLGLRAVMDAMQPASLLPQQIMIEKLRSDYCEFAVYLPLSADGRAWGRWLFTERLNAGNSGSTRCFLVTKATLNKSTPIPVIAENQTTQTEAQAATFTAGTSGGAYSGTWTASATVSGVTDIRYSSVVGDKVTFTVTASRRIALRAISNPTNGGVVEVLIKDGSGTPISTGKYSVPLVGGVATLSLVNSAQLHYIELADNLPLGDYTVELTLSASSPAGGRLYVGGVRGYALIAYNAVGRMGLWADSSVGGNATKMTTYPGGGVCYSFTGTGVVLHYLSTNNAGIMTVKVCDSAGVEVSASAYGVEDKEIDGYSGGFRAQSVAVVGGLPYGTYFLLIEATARRNAASTGYRAYDMGISSVDETQAGTLGVDSFFNHGTSNSFKGSSSIGANSMLAGTGNMELAIRARSPLTGEGTEEFCGGTHGHESAMSGLAFSADGSPINLTSAPDGTKWICSTFNVSFSTQLLLPVLGDPWADVSYRYALSPYGYAASIDRTVIKNTVIYDQYTLMLQCPKSTTLGAAYDGKAAGGPFVRWAVDGDSNYTLPTADASNAINISQYNVGAVAYNDSYAVYGFNTDAASIRAGYLQSDIGKTGNLALLQNRPDGLGKYYNRAFRPESGGTLLIVGDHLSYTNVYRVVQSKGLAVALAN